MTTSMEENNERLYINYNAFAVLMDGVVNELDIERALTFYPDSDYPH